MKTLTITIPSYNVEKYLPETIPYFLKSDVMDDVEILIVNDGSKDQTAEVAQKYCAQYPDSIFLINKENGGHGSTINTGLENAHGKYFRVIDGDDWVNSGNFSSYVNKLKELEEDLIITPYNKVYMDTHTTELCGVQGLDANTTYDIDDVVNCFENMYCIHSATFKTEKIRGMHKISEHCFYVDMEYICYALPKIQSVRLLDDVVYQYRLGTPGQSMSKANRIKNRAMHKRVTLNLMRFFREGDLSPAKKQYLEEVSIRLLGYQMDIFYMMPISNETKKEIMEFLEEAKKTDEEIFGKIKGKANRMIIQSGGKNYVLATILWRIKRIKK